LWGEIRVIRLPPTDEKSVRASFAAGLLLLAATLTNCSSGANMPLGATRSWSAPGAPTVTGVVYAAGPRARSTKMARVAHPDRVAHAEAANNDGTVGISTSLKDDLKAFSPEWYQREAEGDARIKRIISICRNC